MAGFGAFAAGMAVRLAAARATFPVIASLPSFAFTLAGAVLISSITAAFVMPDRTAIMRDVRGEDDPPVPAHVTLLLVLLCGLAMLQVPGVVSWWHAEQAILATVLPARPHESGFEYIPVALAYALPALATLTLVLFAITSLLGIVAPSKLAVRVIAAGVLLQLGYIAAAVISGAEIHTITATLGPILADDPDAARTFAEWITTHEGAAGPTTQRLVWTSAGYIFAAVVAALSPATETSMAQMHVDVERPRASTETAAAISYSPVTSDASAVFDESQYSVHPRLTLIEALFTRTCNDFEIRCIPHTSRKWFSFSWTNGLLKQHPAGKDLAKITPADSPGLFWDRKYEVVDPATGHTIARFVPQGEDWEITDPSDVLIARVLCDSKHGIVRFRAMIGEAEAVRFKWALAGLSVYSAQLEIEFLTSPNQQPRSPDRVLAIAIAPILEQRVRIQHVRANG
jgi:hypothetical protein